MRTKDNARTQGLALEVNGITGAGGRVRLSHQRTDTAGGVSGLRAAKPEQVSTGKRG